MTRDGAPQLHLPVQEQLVVAQLELGAITDGLWGAVSYNKDPIAAAQRDFPEPSQRRSDTKFDPTPQEEATLRAKAAILGPGREHTETLEDLGVYLVDAEVIEPGQLHKTVTEFHCTLQSGAKAPIIVFASDRVIPKWVKDKETKQDTDKVDAERLSSDRLLTIGGKGIAASGGRSFFYRAGQYDSNIQTRTDAKDDLADRNDRALTRPSNEYEMTEAFLMDSLDEVKVTTLPVGYDPKTGDVVDQKTGQVRRLGTMNGRDVVLVHKQKDQDGGALDTTQTVLLMGGISSAITGKPEVVMSYWTSATYKPSRWMSGIRAGIMAAQANKKLRVAVPTYGYADLGAIKGEQQPKPPTIQNIASEMGKAAQEAAQLRDFLARV